MSDDISLLQEIDDALRADKAHHFWQKYGKVVLAGCAAIVVLTAISAYWKNHLHEEQMAQTHVMLQAQMAATAGNFAGAAKVLSDDVKERSPDQTALLKLQSAELYLKANQRDKAITMLKDVVALNGADSALHDSAVLRLHALSGDSLAPADGDGRPFSGMADQIKAASLIKEGKNKEAAVLLKTIIATSATYSPERSQATELLQLTGESTEK